MDSDLNAGKQALAELGIALKTASQNRALLNAVLEAESENPWFTRENILYALQSWACSLEEDKVTRWLEAYPGLQQNRQQKKVGLVLAGNIPMVGFHDLLCCLAAGHKVIARQSSDDLRLLPAVIKVLGQYNPEMAGRVTFTEELLKDFDAIIATGSNNTSRYFEYYFGKYPNIIRKNRNGAGVLTGNETGEELQELGRDIFAYFGLGCRNISKLYVPADYNFNSLLEAFEPFREAGDHHKYRNNYDYQKSVFLVNNLPFHDNGFVLLKEDTGLSSPISVLHYEYCRDLAAVHRPLKADPDRLQCIVSAEAGAHHAIPPGTSQQPELWDYADAVDTMEFLLGLT